MPRPLPPGSPLPRAHRVLISLEKIQEAGGRGKIGPAAVLDLLRRAQIDVAEVINWSRDPQGRGFVIFYHGESPSHKATQFLA